MKGHNMLIIKESRLKIGDKKTKQNNAQYGS